MSYLFKKTFWMSVLERSVKTFLQVLVAGLTFGSVSGALGVDLHNLNWKNALWLALGATVLSVLSSIASGPVGQPDNASLVKTS